MIETMWRVATDVLGVQPTAAQYEQFKQAATAVLDAQAFAEFKDFSKEHPQNGDTVLFAEETMEGVYQNGLIYCKGVGFTPRYWKLVRRPEAVEETKSGTPYIVNEVMLQLNPELKEAGASVGDTIYLGQQVSEVDGQAVHQVDLSSIEKAAPEKDAVLGATNDAVGPQLSSPNTGTDEV